MGGGVVLFQLLDADLGVNLRRAQLGMSQELLDEPDVGPTFKHQCGASVAEQVATATLAKIGGVDVFADKLRESVRGERLEQVGEEQRAVVRLPHEAGARSPMGIIRSLRPLPWRTINVPRS